MSWNKARWTTTLYANYIGPTPNYRATLDPDGHAFAGAGRLGSYTTANASVNFDVTEDLKLSFLSQQPGQPDAGHGCSFVSGNSGEPYNSSNFNLLGRAYYVEAKWNFGKGK